MQQTKVAVQEVLRVLIDVWTPHNLSLDWLMFSKEVDYWLSVSGAIEEYRERYGGWIFFALEKGVEWPLLYLKFFCSLTHQLVYF